MKETGVEKMRSSDGEGTEFDIIMLVNTNKSN